MQNLLMNIGAGLLLASGVAVAQNAEVEPGSVLDRDLVLSELRSGDNIILDLKLDAKDAISGFQFDVKYDPARFRVADLSNCLTGLPSTHQGEFSLCNDVPEKGLVRFVVLDLGRNRMLQAPGSLGSIRFLVKADGQAIGKEYPVIDNVMLADLEGMELKNRKTAEPVVSKITIR